MRPAFVIASLCLAGCALITLPARVRARHAAEFHCDRDQIDVQQIGSATFRGIGCGVEAIYVCIENACMRDSEPSRR